MKQIKANVNHGSMITSDEIRNIIENSNYFEQVRDISESVYDDDVLAYNIKLDHSILENEIERDLEEEGYMMDEDDEYTSVLLEQAEYFIDAAVDEIKDEIETKYHIEHVGSAYDVYQGSRDVEDIQFVLTLSFGATNHGQLYELTNSIIDKNYTRNMRGLH